MGQKILSMCFFIPEECGTASPILPNQLAQCEWGGWRLQVEEGGFRRNLGVKQWLKMGYHLVKKRHGHRTNGFFFLILLQLGSSIFCQWAINFLCYEATRQESPERIGDLSLLLQKGNPDVQAAVLTWLWDNEERRGLKSNEELQLTFMVRSGFIQEGTHGIRNVVTQPYMFCKMLRSWSLLRKCREDCKRLVGQTDICKC